jgi:hypothetical protein
LAACKKHGELKSANSEAELQQQLSGTWKVERDFTNGGLFQSTVMVASNGIYVCDATNFGSKGVRPVHIEGTWEIKDGFLIDTMTKHSHTNARLPFVSSEKIIHFSTNELVVQYEYGPSNYIEAVFKKEPGN